MTDINRPWTVKYCRICGEWKVWIGDTHSTEVRIRVCPKCDGL